MKKTIAEIVRTFDGLYYINLHINGKYISGIPEYTTYRELQSNVFERTGIIIPRLKNLQFERIAGKSYAILEL